MKKRLLILSMILAVALSLVGCVKDKTPATVEQFKEKTNGYSLNPMSPNTVKVKEAWKATKDDVQIEFYVMSIREHAESAYETNKKKIENISSSPSKNVSSKIKNYGYYRRTTANAYFMVGFIENTFIYMEAPKEKEQEMIDLAKELGYM